jgi:hypothetical protein
MCPGAAITRRLSSFWYGTGPAHGDSSSVGTLPSHIVAANLLGKSSRICETSTALNE